MEHSCDRPFGLPGILIARHNQLLRIRSNGQRLETSLVPPLPTASLLAFAHLLLDRFGQLFDLVCLLDDGYRESILGALVHLVLELLSQLKQLGCIVDDLLLALSVPFE